MNLVVHTKKDLLGLKYGSDKEVNIGSDHSYPTDLLWNTTETE